MEELKESIIPKKLLIFGAQGSGKTSLTKRIEKDIFENEQHTDHGNNKKLCNI